jgi:hypothetical protein
MDEPSAPPKRQKTDDAQPLAVETFEVSGVPADIEILVGAGEEKKSFTIHRFALSSWSSTFANMFVDFIGAYSGPVSSSSAD